MIKWIETTGRSEEDAIAAALFQLGLERDDVSVEVLERAKSGFFGFGSNPAKVRVSFEAGEDGNPIPKKDEFSIDLFEQPAAKEPEKPVPVQENVKPEPVKEEPAQPEIPEEKKACKTERPHLEPGDEIIMAAPEKRERKAPVPKPPVQREPKKHAAPPQSGKQESRAAVPVVPISELPLADAEDPRAAQIAQFLSGLMEHLHVTATPEIHVSEDGFYRVVLQGSGLGAVIGRRGETLDAIQQLTNYAVNHGQAKRVRIHIDAEGYRAKREESLQRLAVKVAGKVTKYRKNVMLEAMNAYERHVIHTALQDYPGVTTYSTGVEPNRRTVVAYAPDQK